MRPFLYQNLKLLILAILLPFSLTSCGYHRSSSEDKTTLSIPYVEGDSQGQLTAELVRQIASYGIYDFVKKDGDLTLTVTLVGDKSDVIGFQYDLTEKKGKIERNLMPQENRRIITAQVTVTRGCTDEVVVGPLNISASTDFDYIDVNSLKTVSFINDGKREKTISFSLGQLDSIEGAQDASLTPIYRQLAQKIALALQRANIDESKKLSDD